MKWEGGERWGKTGEGDGTKAEGVKEGRAIYASGYWKRGAKRKKDG